MTVIGPNIFGQRKQNHSSAKEFSELLENVSVTNKGKEVVRVEDPKMLLDLL